MNKIRKGHCITCHINYNGNNRTQVLADCENTEDPHEPKEQVHNVQHSCHVLGIVPKRHPQNEGNPEKNDSQQIHPVPYSTSAREMCLQLL